MALAPLSQTLVLTADGTAGILLDPVTIPAGDITPAPSFTAAPTISPTSGNTGTTFTATDGVVAQGSVTGRRWLLNGSVIETGATVTPGSPGSLVLENTATGPGGTVTASSAAATVTAIPAPAFSGNPRVSPASGDTATTYTATDPTITNGTITARQWLLGTTVLGTDTTIVPGSGNTGQLTRKVTGTGMDGSTITATSSAVTVLAATAPLAISGTPGAAAQSNYYRFTPTTSGGSGTKTYALTGTLPTGLSFSTSSGAIAGTPTGSGTASGLSITVTDNSGSATLPTFSIAVTAQATRAYTFADAPTKPTLWVDAQDAATFTPDANGRVLALASKGSSTGAGFTAADAAHAPLYQATGFNGELPALKFTMTRADLLTSAFQGPSQPCTVIHVWQEPASGQNPYCCVSDYRSSGGGDGGRASIFNFYNSTTAMSIFVSGSATGRNAFANAYNQINVMVLEYNGANSRAYLNGVVTALTDIGASAVIFGAGMTLGGKGAGDTYTSFNGMIGETTVFPGVFTGDDWDRVTQGLMWKWKRQASIAAGATYKSAAPTVRMAVSGTPLDGYQGYAYSFVPTVTGATGTKTFALTGTLPAGLSFSTTTGAITGTPTGVGTSSGLLISVTDSVSTVTLGPLSITTSVPPAAFSFGNPNVSWGDSNLSLGR